MAKRKSKKKGHFYCKCGQAKKVGAFLCADCKRKTSRKVIEAKRQGRRKKDRDRKKKKREEAKNNGAVLVTHNGGIKLKKVK